MDQVLTYLLSLSGTLILPVSIWIAATWRISRLLNFSPENYQELVREQVESVLIDKISERLDSLFPDYGLTPPTRSAPFSTIIDKIVAESPDRLTFLTQIYNSLVENGLQSPFFHQVVHEVLFVMGGG